VRGGIGAILLIPKNRIWPSVLFARGMGNYTRTPMVWMFAENVGVLDPLKKERKRLKKKKIRSK